MENETKQHRPIGELIDEILAHPDSVRLEWVNKLAVEEYYEQWLDSNFYNSDTETSEIPEGIPQTFDEFWEKYQEKLKEEAYLLFSYNDYFFGSFFDETFLEGK